MAAYACDYAMGNWLSGGTAQLRRGGSEHSSALSLGGGVGSAGGRGAAGELAPVGAFVLGPGSAGGKHGGGGRGDAGGAQPLVFGPGRAVGARPDGRPLAECGVGAHRGAWWRRQAGQASCPRSGEGRLPAGWPCGQGGPKISWRW